MQYEIPKKFLLKYTLSSCFIEFPWCTNSWCSPFFCWIKNDNHYCGKTFFLTLCYLLSTEKFSTRNHSRSWSNKDKPENILDNSFLCNFFSQLFHKLISVSYNVHLTYRDVWYTPHRGVCIYFIQRRVLKSRYFSLA